MLPKYLADRVANFTFSPDRPKVSGRMYDGKATAIIGQYLFDLALWHHGGNNETAESLQSHLGIKAVIVDGEYHDAFWHVLLAEDGLWFHKQGWFDNKNLKSEPLIDKRSNINLGVGPTFSPEDERKLIDMGFVKIIEA